MLANDLKEQGNKLFAVGKFKDAALAYSKAISKNDRVAAYYSNRALCYLKAGDWEAVMQDCRRAIELEPNSVKGHVFLGQALMELNLLDEAVSCLQRADALSKEQQVDFGDEIAQLVRVAKKRRFLKEEAKQIREESELQSFLIALICSNTRRRIEEQQGTNRGHKQQLICPNAASSSGSEVYHVDNTSEACSNLTGVANRTSNGFEVYQARSDSDAGANVQPAESTDDEYCECESDEQRAIREQWENEAKRRVRQVEELFARVEERRRKRDVPDFLCGKISFELLREPVITPSGITYDRRDIEEHLNRVGHFDPVTRAPLTHDQLISNLAMKEVVDNFVEDNPWAVDY